MFTFYLINIILAKQIIFHFISSYAKNLYKKSSQRKYFQIDMPFIITSAGLITMKYTPVNSYPQVTHFSI